MTHTVPTFSMPTIKEESSNPSTPRHTKKISTPPHNKSRTHGVLKKVNHSKRPPQHLNSQAVLKKIPPERLLQPPVAPTGDDPLKHLNSHFINMGLKLLKENKLYTENSKRVLNKHPEHAYGIACALVRLKQTKLYRGWNLTALMGKIPYADRIAGALNRLDSEGLANQDNYEVLIKHPQYAPTFAAIVCKLKQEGLYLPENRNLLIQNIEFSPDLCLVLHRMGKGITQDNYSTLFRNQNFLKDILKELKSSKVVNQDDFKILIQKVRHTFEQNSAAFFSIRQAARKQWENGKNSLSSLLIHSRVF